MKSSLDDPARRANLGQSIEIMLRVRWILAGLLLLPIAELAVFLAVAAKIGVVAALILVLASSLAGAALLRGGNGGIGPALRAGLSRRDLGAAGFPGIFTVAAGVLLLVPGFLTDIAGALLLVPAIQRQILGRLLRGISQPRRDSGELVELDPAEWRRVAEEAPPGGRGRAANSCPPAPPVLATPPESGSSASRAKEEP